MKILMFVVGLLFVVPGLSYAGELKSSDVAQTAQASISIKVGDHIWQNDVCMEVDSDPIKDWAIISLDTAKKGLPNGCPLKRDYSKIDATYATMPTFLSDSVTNLPPHYPGTICVADVGVSCGVDRPGKVGKVSARCACAEADGFYPGRIY